jgi:hypothetical protein
MKILTSSKRKKKRTNRIKWRERKSARPKDIIKD